MGTVVDAMRGKPGDKRVLKLERDGKRSPSKPGSSAFCKRLGPPSVPSYKFKANILEETRH